MKYTEGIWTPIKLEVVEGNTRAVVKLPRVVNIGTTTLGIIAGHRNVASHSNDVYALHTKLNWRCKVVLPFMHMDGCRAGTIQRGSKIRQYVL